MLPSEPIEHGARRLGAAGVHVGESPLHRLDRFDPFEEMLVGFRILHHHFCASVNGEDQRIPGGLIWRRGWDSKHCPLLKTKNLQDFHFLTIRQIRKADIGRQLQSVA